MENTNTAVTIVDKATRALEKAATDFQKITTGLTELKTNAQELAFEIEELESKKISITTEINEMERTEVAELKIRVLENSQKVLTELLEAKSLAYLPIADLENLREKLSNVQEIAQKEQITAIHSLKAALNSTCTSTITELKATQSVNTAELKANNTALSAEIAFLKSNNTTLAKTIEDERKARVEMFSNQSQPTINVNSDK